MSFNFGWGPLIHQLIRPFYASAAQGEKADTAVQPAAVGVSVQSHSSELDDIASIDTDGGLRRRGGAWAVAPISPGLQQGRLSVSNTDPAVTSGTNNDGVIWFLPYEGNQISLRDDSNWVINTFGPKSISLPNVGNTTYDIFAAPNGANDITLSIVAWTNDASRSISLSRLDGVLVRPADNARYIGSVRTNALSHVPDEPGQRFLWNYANRLPVLIEYQIPAVSHTYIGDWRVFDNNLNYRAEAITGIDIFFDCEVYAGVEEDGGISLALNSTVSGGNVALKQSETGAGVVATLGGTMRVQLGTRKHEFYLIQSSIGAVRVFEGTTGQTAGIFGTWYR